MKMGIIAVGAVLCGSGLLRFLSVCERTNPAVVTNRTIEANLELTPTVAGIIDKACADCHSNATRWPWYSQIPPASWFVVQDVNRARNAMNFSEWSIQAGRKRSTAIGVLAAACEGARMGRMPPAAYRWMHAGARLNPGEIESLCEWTTAEMRHLAVRAAAVRRARSPIP